MYKYLDIDVYKYIANVMLGTYDIYVDEIASYQLNSSNSTLLCIQIWPITEHQRCNMKEIW